jgi:hypothetical protein
MDTHLAVVTAIALHIVGMALFARLLGRSGKRASPVRCFLVIFWELTVVMLIFILVGVAIIRATDRDHR